MQAAIHIHSPCVQNTYHWEHYYCLWLEHTYIHIVCLTNFEIARDDSILNFVGPEPALGDSRQDIQRRIRRWLVNQCWVCWWGLGDTQRQAQDLISGPCLGAKARFQSCNRTQSTAVTGLLTAHNTVRRHLHHNGAVSPLCRCGAEDETSAHIVCECEALASLRHVYLGSFFFEPEDIKSILILTIQGCYWPSYCA